MSKYISRWRTCQSRPLFPLEIDQRSLRLGASSNIEERNAPCSLQSQASGVIVFKTGKLELSNETSRPPKTVQITMKGWNTYENFKFKDPKTINTTKIENNNTNTFITVPVSTPTQDGLYNPWFEIKITFPKKQEYNFIIPYPVFGQKGFINGSTLRMFIQEDAGLEYAYKAFLQVDGREYFPLYLTCK